LISSNNPFIVKKQADLLFRNVRLGQISSILNASFLLWVVTSLNTSESHLAVAIWWLVATVTAILRIWIANKYLAKDDVTRLDNAALWQKRAVLGAGASGIVWGAGALLLMFGATTTMQLFTAFVMAGVVAGAGYRFWLPIARLFATTPGLSCSLWQSVRWAQTRYILPSVS
jgi:hypothetical protein